MFELLILLCVAFGLMTFCLTTVSTAFRRIRRHQPKAKAIDVSKLLFYFKIQKLLFPKYEFDVLFFAITCARNIFYLCYSILSLVLGYYILNHYASPLSQLNDGVMAIAILVIILLFILVTLFVTVFAPQYCARHNPHSAIKILAPISSILLTLCLPFSYLFLKMTPLIFKGSGGEQDHQKRTSQIKDKIIELVEESDALGKLDIHHKKLIESVITFKDRIVREVMNPRINIFSLPSTTTIREATKLMAEKGFSRTPIHEDNIDNIVGVLMYKDLLSFYMQCDQKGDLTPLDKPVKILTKDALYTPETKKVLPLLQEFRAKQIHIAIVVDEYGGTEGIITIEDILEEIVGEISDEYDKAEEILYTTLHDGGWIIDACMTIFDIEEELDIKIPQEGDYDTLGGYISHRAGEVPAPGCIIYQDNLKLEVLDSNERCVEKVKLTVMPTPYD